MGNHGAFAAALLLLVKYMGILGAARCGERPCNGERERMYQRIRRGLLQKQGHLRPVRQ